MQSSGGGSIHQVVACGCDWLAGAGGCGPGCTGASAVQVIVAGAGGAAHLPGMVAALTPLPVIGVPVTPAGAHLDGLDALASIVQMPRGVPVATVAIGNATNAGLLAVRVLAASRPELLKFMVNFQRHQQEIVEFKAAKLEAEGWQAYMERMEKKS